MGLDISIFLTYIGANFACIHIWKAFFMAVEDDIKADDKQLDRWIIDFCV